jgi:D-glycero-alpha-D-manno-heptose 1-phosphate guanylyltransferase
MKRLNEAVILAGGKGTRLQPVVADRPKVLAAVCGRPFLAYLLDQVAAAGISHTILCVGYRAQQVQAALGKQYAGMSLTYSREATPLGTGGALRLAQPLTVSETLIVMNGDSFCEVNLRDLWEWHQARQSRATLVLTHMSDTARYGRVSSSTAGEISNFEEKGRTAGEGWVNAGIYVVKSEMVRAIPLECAVSLEHDVFSSWIGQRLYGYRSRGHFLDIGTPESYGQADALFASYTK